jgi:class 3 adenylate cyclase
LALLVGFLSWNKRIAELAATVLVLALSVSFFMRMGGVAFWYVVFGLSFAKKLADEGYALREKQDPVSDRPVQSAPIPAPVVAAPAPVNRSGRVSRQELLDQVMTLQAELQRQKQRRTFLSIDVVDSSHLVQSGSELAAEHTFNVFKMWLETIVRRNGGEIQSSAGDGAMCIFADDASAIRAARQLQADLDMFNQNRNRLPLPFRIRCGISAGSVPIEEGAPIRDIQSPAIYRAAQMQKQAQPGGIVVSEEVSAAALQELGDLSLVENTAETQGALEWRGPNPNIQRNIQ